MKLRLHLTALICCFFSFLQASCQLPDTDIFVADMEHKNGQWTFSTPENITKRNGYDNQPYFSPDQTSLLFVSIADSQQADVYQYNFREKNSVAVTQSPESEYSPEYVPGGNALSVVRVDQDSAQRMYLLPEHGKGKPEYIPGTDSIGYYCWVGTDKIAMFILGEPQTLQLLDIKNGQRRFIAEKIGRCIRLSKDGNQLFFIHKKEETVWELMSMNLNNYAITKLTNTLPQSEDFCVLPDNSILMGKGSQLFRWEQEKVQDWTLSADFSPYIQKFYRISINSTATKIALVVYSGTKP